jgi:predicted esterase
MPHWRPDLLTMPIWAFHGLDDDIVSPRHTIEMIDALVDCNPNLKCDLYEGVAHNSWDIAFREELINWFLSYKKAE